MIINRIPRAYKVGGGNAYPGEYVELTPSSYTLPLGAATWLDLDVSALGVPKGCVVDMYVSNHSQNEQYMGCRATNSSLYRAININGYRSLIEGEVGARFITQSDASGKIKIYALHSQYEGSMSRFYVKGYWQNVTFTERFDAPIDTVGADSWTSVSAQSGTNRVHDIALSHDYNGLLDMGVREIGSTTERRVEMNNSYGGGYTTMNMMVQVNTGGFQLYYDRPTSMVSYDMGYFDDTVTFEERFDAISYDSFVSPWATFAYNPAETNPGVGSNDMIFGAGPNSASLVGARNMDSNEDRYILMGSPTTTAGLTYSPWHVTSSTSGEVNYIYRTGYYTGKLSPI